MALRGSPADADALTKAASTLADQAREMAVALERQQFETPLSDLSSELRLLPETLPVLVACLDAAAKTSVSELFAIEQPAKASDSLRAGPLRVAWNLDEIARDLQAFQQFCAAGRLLILATAADGALSAGHLALVQSLLTPFDLTVVLCFAPATAAAQRDRLAVPRSANQVLVLSADGADFPAAKRALLLADSPWMQLPLLAQQACRLRAVIDDIRSRHAFELTRVSRRLELESARTQNAGSRRNPKTDARSANVAKEALEQNLSATMRDLDEQCELSLQPLGPLSGLMKQLTQELKIEDLEQQVLPKTIRKFLGAQQLAAINQRVADSLKQRLEADLSFADARLQSSASEAEAQLRPAVGPDFALRFKLPQHEQQWRTLQNLVSVGRETFIDLPRHSVFELITAGRQKVFMLTMFVMLATKIGIKQEDLVRWVGKTATDWISSSWAVVLVGVFITSIITAIRTRRHDKEEQELREMEKIRESLYGDGMKVLDKVQNSRVSTLVGAIKEQSKSWQREIDQAVKNWAEQSEVDFEQESRRLEAGRRQAENQRKSLLDLDKLSLRLEQSVSEHERAVDTFTVEARSALQQQWQQLTASRPAAPRSPPAESTPRASTADSPAAASAAATDTKVASTDTASPEAAPAKSSAADRLAERRARRAQRDSENRS